MFLGITLILIGIILFLEQWGLIHGDIGDYIIPVLLIALGISIITKKHTIEKR